MDLSDLICCCIAMLALLIEDENFVAILFFGALTIHTHAMVARVCIVSNTYT